MQFQFSFHSWSVLIFFSFAMMLCYILIGYTPSGRSFFTPCPSRAMFVVVALVVLLLSLPAPSAGDQLFCADANSKYNPNSTYRASLRSLADELTARATKSYSATGTAGTGADKVYGAVLCRGDSTGTDCSGRLREAFGRTINADSTRASACALHKDVALYTELYQLRFSHEDFLSTFSNAPEWVDGTNLNLVPATDARQFDELVAKLTRSLAEAAATQPDRYATADGPWPSPESERTVYGLAQCTRDMPPERCRACLHGIAAEIRRRIGSGRMGGAIHGARCTLRYETGTQFFTKTATGQRKGHALLIIATVYSLSVVCTRLLFCVLYIIKRKKRGKINSTEQPKNIDEILRLWKMEDTGSEFSLYDFSQIADATDNFSPGKLLGQGGFGPVYKGIFPDGQEVAIKKLAARSRQGLVEFKNEIQLVAKLQHRHLVRLLGCCIHNEEKILIYEYMSNKSLDYFIFDPNRRISLNWMIRLKIVEGIAQGLLYLHEHSRLRIIHRDLKASNILLDSELNPKISDFGMARIFPSDATQTKTSRLVGTYGYMAPEYAFQGLLSIKSDVFSFGVLLLEIISGKRSAGFQHYGGEFDNLLQYAWQMWEEERWDEFIDQSIGDEYEPGDMKKYLRLALMCVQMKAVDRPTMSDIVAMLSSDDITVPEPRQPAYSYTRVDASIDINLSCTRNGKTNFFRWNNAVLVGVGGFLLVISISCLVFHIWVKTQRRREQTIFKLGRLYLSIQIAINLWRMGGANPEFSLYDFSQIKEATNNFSIGNKLGQGGFGPVYKGRLRNGHKIAVKRLETASLQGLLEFQNEIQLIAKVQHKNLVKLLGCCTQGDREKMLIYEYMENKSLDYFIFDIIKGRRLNWSKRLRIIDGTAQGLLYLHNYSRICIVHRDLKASNILLDSAMNPKISDFGVARIFCSNMAESNTTRIVGTHGYIPPEYAFEGVCSIKTDVFSFGVLILEIISGNRTAQFYRYNGKLYNLIAYAWQLWIDGKWSEMTYCPPENENQEIERCVHVALLCVQESAEDRPAMERVVTMLNTKNMSLPPPKQPAYFHVNPSEQEVSSCNITISITLER